MFVQLYPSLGIHENIQFEMGCTFPKVLKMMKCIVSLESLSAQTHKNSCCKKSFLFQAEKTKKVKLEGRIRVRIV